MIVMPLPPALDTRANTGAFPSTDETGAGLTSSECFAIAAAARRLPGKWDMEWDEDDRGHASIALMPRQNGSIDDACVFLVWRERGQLHVGVGQDDVYVDLGTRGDVTGVMATIRLTLEAAQFYPELTRSAWKHA